MPIKYIQRLRTTTEEVSQKSAKKLYKIQIEIRSLQLPSSPDFDKLTYNIDGKGECEASLGQKLQNGASRYTRRHFVTEVC